MIIILSNESDASTNAVIDWLAYFNEEFVRINPTDVVSNIKISPSFNIEFDVNGKSIDMSKVKSFWYRRGSFNIETHQIKSKRFPFSRTLNNHLKSESATLAEFVLKGLAKKNGLGDFYNSDVNKFNVLQRAKDVGLKVPPTIVTTRRKDVQDFASKEGSIITKACGEVIMSFNKHNSVFSYTRRLERNQIDELPEDFSPSLFQTEIKKKYELRIFYLKGDFYSMAIFSQQDKQTEVDFRVYNRIKPNRSVPYKLPDEISAKLHLLMLDLELQTGSIDLIFTEDSEYVFLEVNPVGQYDMVSFPCNYDLHKRIAQRLSNPN